MLYTYYYAGDKLVRMTVGTDKVMDFTYDQNGQPYSVTYNGTKAYYVLNQQGDVVRIVTAGGASRGVYYYDAWGNILYNTDNDFLNYNPLRYRGYVYDTETQLYYCQSRYYDPATGRFINADSFTSTGQGILGNHMFAYCNNNPIQYMDDSETNAKLIKPLGNGVSKENEALDKMRELGLTLYKDAPLTQVNNGRSAFTFGYIFMGASGDANLLKHEYGHIVQSRELGVYGYIMFIVLPSVIGYGIDSLGLLPENTYYSLPWEYKADEYGGASHRYQAWAKPVSDAYWTYAKFVSNSIF